MRPDPGASVPATEWIRVTSSASPLPRAGRIDSSLRPSIVFPVPGGPARQQVVAAGRRQLRRSPPALLPAHVGEVGQGCRLSGVVARRRGHDLVLPEGDSRPRLCQMAHTDGLDSQ